MREITEKTQKSQSKAVQTEIESDWMNNVQEIIANLVKKNDELQKQLNFKIEENAALKKIIKNIDDDSKQYKEKVT